MRHARLWIVLPLAVVCLGGCYYRGPVGGPGTTIINTPFVIPPPLPPPPGVSLPPEPGVGTHVPALPPDGAYRGVAKALSNPGQNCDNTIAVTQWMVAGGQVDYRDFSGTIGPGGGLKMQFGDAYIIGTWRGAHFEGRYWRPFPGCTYVISVDPA